MLAKFGQMTMKYGPPYQDPDISRASLMGHLEPGKKMRNWIESDHFPEDHRVRISTKVPEKLGEMSIHRLNS